MVVVFVFTIYSASDIKKLYYNQRMVPLPQMDRDREIVLNTGWRTLYFLMLILYKDETLFLV